MFDPDIPVFDIGEYKSDNNILEKIKSNFPYYDENYIANCSFKERRVVLEKAYNECKPYLDKLFDREIRVPGKFMDRLWELALCSILLHNGYKLIKSDNNGGPDFCILKNGKKIWIEAACPDLEIVDPVDPPPILTPGVVFSRTINIESDTRPKALRISSAFSEKIEKRKKYIKNKFINENDKFIIAINTHRVDNFAPTEMPEELVLYGFGLTQITHDGIGNRQFTPVITKNVNDKKIPIPVAYFLRPEYKNISGAIFFRKWFEFDNNWKQSLSNQAVTYFNEDSLNSLDKDDIVFGKIKTTQTDNKAISLIDIK